MEKQKLIVICGPTTTGKSALAVQLAKKWGGEIISADSRQVYRGLDIGSGKITQKEMAHIPHHLLSIANLKKQFSVTLFQQHGQKAIKDILKHGKTPIIVGGTGLYIDALVYDTKFPEVPPNTKLRKILEKKKASQLFHILAKLDPRRASDIDRNNPIRLIRAIEIAKALGKVPELKKITPYDVLWIGLKTPPQVLQSNIHTRLIARMKQGLVNEVKTLHKNGMSWKRLNELGLEYRFVALYLQRKINKQEMLAQLETAINQYARRQMTWFKANKNIDWFDVDKNTLKKIDTKIKTFT